MALTDLVLDCKLYRKKSKTEMLFFFEYQISLLVYEMTNAGRVDMSDFELLKVLGTGGKSTHFVFKNEKYFF